MKKYLLTAALLVAGVGIAGAAEPSSKRKPQVRFLMVSDDLPIQYKRGANGALSMVFAAGDQEPPSVVYFKKGHDYVPFGVPRNNLSKPYTVDTKSGAESGYFMKIAAGLDVNESLVGYDPKTGTRKPGVGESAKSEPDNWAMFAKAAPQNGKDHIVCAYQPSTKTKWFPPHTKYIDSSAEAFPSDSATVVNLSDRVVVVKVGAGAPKRLGPGEQAGYPGLKTPADVPLVVATAGKSGQLESIFNRSKSLQAGERALFVIYSMYEPGSPKPIAAKFLVLPAPEA